MERTFSLNYIKKILKRCLISKGHNDIEWILKNHLYKKMTIFLMHETPSWQLYHQKRIKVAIVEKLSFMSSSE